MSDSSPAIVLVRPRNPNNIGAAARAMRNFGFSELVIVAPHPPVWEEALKSAVGAESVIQNARVVETLVEAISDCSIVVGSVDPRRGVGLTPAMLRMELSQSVDRTALVFGPEKSGLTNEDLSYCHRIVSIPTVEQCPSMNLGQAVAICCYEFARDGELSSVPPMSGHEESIATVGEVEALLDESTSVLKSAGFLSDQNQDRMTVEMRRSFLRFGLTHREVTHWRGALRRISRRLRL